MASALQLAEEIVNQARRSPDPRERSAVLRRGAQMFIGLAADPRNVKSAKRLQSVAYDLVGASMAETGAHGAPTTSDFLQLMRDRHEAFQQLGPDAAFESGGMDATAIQQSQIAPASDPNVSPRMSIQPASFNQNTTLGRTATVTFAPTPDQVTQGIFQSQTVAFWQGTKLESQAMSVDVGAVIPPAVNLAVVNDARPFATIQYGSDGNTQNSVVCDVGLGRRIVVPCNYLSVLVGMDPPGFNLASAVMSLGASIGTFAAPTTAPVTRTVYVDGIANGSTSNFLQIPARATQILPMFVPFDTTQIDITLFNFSGFGLVDWRWVFSTNTPFMQPLTIPNDAYFFTIRWAGSHPTENLRVVFQLSL